MTTTKGTTKGTMSAADWHEYLVDLALEAYDRTDGHAGESGRLAFAAVREEYARHLRERMAQAAQTIALELPR